MQSKRLLHDQVCQQWKEHKQEDRDDEDQVGEHDITVVLLKWEEHTQIHFICDGMYVVYSVEVGQHTGTMDIRVLHLCIHYRNYKYGLDYDMGV